MKWFIVSVMVICVIAIIFVNGKQVEQMYVNFTDSFIFYFFVDGKALDSAITSSEYYYAGDLRKAFEYANRSIERSPYFGLPYSSRAKIYFDREMYDLTVEDYTRAIDLFYLDSMDYYYRVIFPISTSENIRRRLMIYI